MRIGCWGLPIFRVMLVSSFLWLHCQCFASRATAQEIETTSASASAPASASALAPVPVPAQGQLLAQTSKSDAKGRSRSARPATRPIPRATPAPALPEPLPELPPPLAEQGLPYSIRFIDRPYTLPKGLHDLSLKASAVYSDTKSDSIYFPTYLFDLQYRQPLSNDFTLLWNPLPLGVRYQPKRTETTLTGVSWNIGWQYQGNFGVMPQFSSYLRHNFDKKNAIEMELVYFTFIPFARASSIWSGSFRIGPIFQRSERLAVSPRLSVTVNNVRLENVYDKATTRIESKDVTAESAQLTFPLGFWIGAAIAPNWDCEFEYTLLGTGFRSEHSIHLATIGLTTRW